MADNVFHEEWFSWHALAGLRSALHGKPNVAGHEEALVGKMLAHLLYTEELPKGLDSMFAFAAFCRTQREASHAQIFQDLWVLHQTGLKRGGFFVEFGACDGVKLSNTLLLEREYGWTGILAEPNPIWHGALRKERTAMVSNLCVHPRSGERVEFLAVDREPELSRLAEFVPHDVHEKAGNRTDAHTIAVETIGLTDLLDQGHAPRHIDYLSIDTEGSEYEILGTFDFEKYSIKLITVEHAGEDGKRDAIKALLEGHGYERWFSDFSRWDDWYVLNAG